MSKLTKSQQQNYRYREALAYVSVLLDEVATLYSTPRTINSDTARQRLFEARERCLRVLKDIEPEREVEWL